jgi:hypothetical protein
MPCQLIVWDRHSFGRTSGDLTDTTVQFLDGLSEVLTSGQPDAYYGQNIIRVYRRLDLLQAMQILAIIPRQCLVS